MQMSNILIGQGNEIIPVSPEFGLLFNPTKIQSTKFGVQSSRILLWPLEIKANSDSKLFNISLWDLSCRQYSQVPPPDQSAPLSINGRVVLEFPDSNSFSYSEETVSHQFFFGTFKNRTQLSPYTLIHRLFIGRGISVCWFVPPMKVARLSSLLFCLGCRRFWALASPQCSQSLIPEQLCNTFLFLGTCEVN